MVAIQNDKNSKLIRYDPSSNEYIFQGVRYGNREDALDMQQQVLLEESNKLEPVEIII